MNCDFAERQHARKSFRDLVEFNLNPMFLTFDFVRSRAIREDRRSAMEECTASSWADYIVLRRIFPASIHAYHTTLNGLGIQFEKENKKIIANPAPRSRILTPTGISHCSDPETRCFILIFVKASGLKCVPLQSNILTAETSHFLSESRVRHVRRV